MTRTATDFYPASGLRSSTSGGLSNVGARSYSWSSSPYSVTSVLGSGVDFYSSGVYPEGSHNRANGFPVRCVQE